MEVATSAPVRVVSRILVVHRGIRVPVLFDRRRMILITGNFEKFVSASFCAHWGDRHQQGKSDDEPTAPYANAAMFHPASIAQRRNRTIVAVERFTAGRLTLP